MKSLENDNMKKITLFTLLIIFFVEILFSQTNNSPPGVVINHIPKSTGKYIGSPSICILPNGYYVASHDEFGPKSTEYRSAFTNIFSSEDKGNTWKKIARIDGQFWSNLFFHNDALYIMGTNKHHGNLIIRKSTDGGKTWTNPYDKEHGLILEGEYHTAPVPMLIHKERIWRGAEYATGKTSRWGERYSAVMLSAPINSDLLSAKSWTRSNHLPFDSTYLNGNFNAWLEGNALSTKDGKVVDILRVHTPKLQDEYYAVVYVDKKGKKVSFDKNEFFKMPGASKKFTIRYDKSTNKYWSLVNCVLDEFKNLQANSVRNTLALVSSSDLKQWKIEKIILSHPDPIHYAFQYVDWLFEDDDIIMVSRTAYDDEEGGAKSAHDANYLTFHRIEDFR